MNEVVLNKKVGIERCIKQIKLYYARKSSIPFDLDYEKQDAIAMNLQRACELCIDIANHVVKTKRLTSRVTAGNPLGCCSAPA